MYHNYDRNLGQPLLRHAELNHYAVSCIALPIQPHQVPFTQQSGQWSSREGIIASEWLYQDFVFHSYM